MAERWYQLVESDDRFLKSAPFRYENYEATSGVAGALQHQADRLADELGRHSHDPAVVPTLLKLVTFRVYIDAEGEPTRRRGPRSTLSADEKVVDAFLDARLLTCRPIPPGRPPWR